MRTILLFTFSIALVYAVNAQVKTDFNNRELITERGKFSKNFQGKSPYTIPAQDIKALLENETMENTNGNARLKASKVREVYLEIRNNRDEAGTQRATNYRRFSSTKAISHGGTLDI